MFDFFKDEKQRSKPPTQPQIHVLTEVVSGMGFSRDARDGVDPFVIIKTRSNKELHRTKAVQNDGNPIWTIKTKSLCVLSIPDPGSSKGKAESNRGAFIVEVCDGFRRLATLTLPFEHILQNMSGTRVEHRLQTTKESKLKRTSLVFRFREATFDDMVFLGMEKPVEPRETTATLKQEHVQANDMDFKETRFKNIFQQDMKQKDGVKYYRIMPGPDPKRPVKETEWMTADQIYQETLQPSRNWVNAGHGKMGKIYMEILACDKLPCMDISVNSNDETDPFAAICFEDNLLRTNMLWDQSSPRWMPWTMRAFCLNVRHPTSLLMIGVFDYDENIVDDHDAIGRVVINTSKFYSDTEYLLRYNLHHDPRQMDQTSRGSILIRLRIEWTSEAKAVQASYAAPPRFIINCPSIKSHQVLRYLTRGAIDTEKATVDSVKLYATEVVSYWANYCYFLDVLFETLLWRGRWYISPTKSFWFPIQSMALSGAVLIAVEKPQLCVSMLFFLLAWSLLSINFYASRHPNPWKRVKRSEETSLVLLTGQSFHPAISIQPNQGVEEGSLFERVDELRGERMSKLITEFLYFLLKVYRIYSKTSVTAKFFETPNNQWSFLSGRLYYLHMLLKSLCQSTRLYLALINWQGYYCTKLTTTLIFAGTLYLLPPVHFATWWVIRIFAWSLLGPWMKLLDIYAIHKWYKTADELMKLVHAGKEPEPDLPDFEALLESEVFLNMSKSGRVIGEDAVKLKDMREHVFGQYSEVIPAVDSSRFPSVPLPSSSARPWVGDDHTFVAKEETHVPGQKLSGSMIPKIHSEKESTPQLAKEASDKKNE